MGAMLARLFGRRSSRIINIRRYVVDRRVDTTWRARMQFVVNLFAVLGTSAGVSNMFKVVFCVAFIHSIDRGKA